MKHRSRPKVSEESIPAIRHAPARDDATEAPCPACRPIDKLTMDAIAEKPAEPVKPAGEVSEGLKDDLGAMLRRVHHELGTMRAVVVAAMNCLGAKL